MYLSQLPLLNNYVVLLIPFFPIVKYHQKNDVFFSNNNTDNPINCVLISFFMAFNDTTNNNKISVPLGHIYELLRIFVDTAWSKVGL